MCILKWNNCKGQRASFLIRLLSSPSFWNFDRVHNGDLDFLNTVCFKAFQAKRQQIQKHTLVDYWASGEKRTATSLFALSFSQLQNICHDQNYSKTITTKYHTAGKQPEHVFPLNQTANTLPLIWQQTGYRKSAAISGNTFPILSLCIHCLLPLLTLQ